MKGHALCRLFPSTGSTSTLQEALGGEILIEVRPVYPVPGSSDEQFARCAGGGIMGTFFTPFTC
jgi:hypothetical protein